jgi:hypothetical protein
MVPSSNMAEEAAAKSVRAMAARSNLDLGLRVGIAVFLPWQQSAPAPLGGMTLPWAASATSMDPEKTPSVQA